MISKKINQSSLEEIQAELQAKLKNLSNNGGPAFPVPSSAGITRNLEEAEGMSLRDYFAAQALKSLLITSPVALGEDTSDEMLARRAEMAYRVADSALKARER